MTATANDILDYLKDHAKDSIILQDKNINLVTVKNSKEEEIYVIHSQLYTKDWKGAKGKQKQSEPCKEEALQKKAEIQEQEKSVPIEADSCEKDKISFNINKKLEKEQFRQAESLLNENAHVFAQKISKKRQTVGLEQTVLV
ncbi:16060_t:CDS:2 [Gigaspora margarita]|uniref:16060_t:CDS:1 n=1 Tax=Gigaspora margarita TaxID=4874 RepID=A0ABM8VZD8_GIGMA|nr:16060_t:CDS:2 [Gigaspora margarita]